MSDRVSALDVTALGANRRAMRWVANYVFVVWSVFCAWLGELGLALIGILCIELVNVFWRYLPRQATDMPDPTPAGWRVPMRAARLSLVVWHIAAMASSAFVVTIVLVVIGVVARPSHLGRDNALVAIALGLWLVTRPIWFPRFAHAVFAVAGQLGGDARPTGGARLSIAAGGIDVIVPPQVRSDASARRSWSWHFAFAEIKEMKALTENEAASYTLSALEYDPTIAVRANVDMARYASGQIERPAIYMGGVGPTLMIRGHDFLYYVGLDDDSGPAAVSALQAWQAARATPSPAP
jgi:hypothetical protein